MFILTGSSGFYLKLVATLEEVDSFQLFLHCLLLLIGHVAEWSTVWTQIEAHQLHDTLTTNDVTTVVADDVDNLLSEVLLLTGSLDVAVLPSLDDAYQLLTVVVGCTADATLCTALSQAREMVSS